MTTTHLETLSVEFQLDTSKANKAIKELLEDMKKLQGGATKSSEETAAGVGKITGSLEKLKIATVAYVVLKAAMAATEFSVKTTQANQALERQAWLLGRAPSELVAWGNVAKSFGGSQESIVGMIQGIEGALAQFRTTGGGTEIIQTLSRIGALAKDGRIDIAKLGEHLQSLAKSSPGGVQDAFVFAQKLGIQQPEFKMLMSPGISEKFKMFASMATAIDSNAQSAERLAGKLAILSARMDDFSQVAYSNLLPFFEKAINLANHASAPENYSRFFGKPSSAAPGDLPRIASEIGSEILNRAKEFGAMIYDAYNNPKLDETKKRLEYLSALEKKQGLQPGTLGAQWMAEASMGAGGINSTGARGPFQIREIARKDYNQRTGENVSPEDLDVFEIAAKVAAYTDSRLLGQFGGDRQKMLAAYNWGEGNLANQGVMKMPQQTLEYIQKNEAYMRELVARQQPQAATTSAGASVATHVGELHVHTPSTDGRSVMDDLRRKMETEGIVTLGMVGAQ